MDTMNTTNTRKFFCDEFTEDDAQFILESFRYATLKFGGQETADVALNLARDYFDDPKISKRSLGTAAMFGFVLGMATFSYMDEAIDEAKEDV